MLKVSVIIPTYNPGPYLCEAIRSVYTQTFVDWELVLVDDNSSEDLSWVTREFPRAKYIHQSHGGASVARNNGILRSTGEFVAFMDQDDVWAPGKLARQVAALEAEPTAGVCYCDLALVDADGQAVGGTRTSPKLDANATSEIVLDPARETVETSAMLASLRHFASRFIVPSTVIVRRSALATSGLLDPFIPFSGDYDLLIKLGSRHPVLHVPSTDVFYRKHANNFSDRYDVGRAEVEALVSRYVAYGRSKGDRALVAAVPKSFRRPRSMYSAQAFDCARRSIRDSDYRQMARHLSRSIWFSPTFAAGSIARWARERLGGRRRLRNGANP